MSAALLGDPALWHDVECGAYHTDLPIWEELAGPGGGPVLELGCGTGRVALHLARLGHRVTGIDSDPALVEELRRRAAREKLAVGAELADASAFSLPDRFESILAPMQLIQLLPGRAARGKCLTAVAAHLRPGGVAALAIVEGADTGTPPSPALPDTRERDGCVYSSLPLGVSRDNGELLVERLRQTVSPDGHLEESRDVVRLQILTAAGLEGEAIEAGLRPVGRRDIEASDLHVGSTVLLMEA